VDYQPKHYLFEKFRMISIMFCLYWSWWYLSRCYENETSFRV